MGVLLMSETLHLVCVSHDPPISSDEVGQRTSFLPYIRQAIRDHADVGGAVMDFIYQYGQLDNPHDSAIFRFLEQHSGCEWEIHGEYGDRYPVTPADPKDMGEEKLP